MINESDKNNFSFLTNFAAFHAFWSERQNSGIKTQRNGDDQQSLKLLLCVCFSIQTNKLSLSLECIINCNVTIDSFCDPSMRKGQIMVMKSNAKITSSLYDEHFEGVPRNISFYIFQLLLTSYRRFFMRLLFAKINIYYRKKSDPSPRASN